MYIVWINFYVLKVEQKFCNKCTLKTLPAGAASKPLKMMIKMFNQNDTQSAAVFECEVDIFRGVIKMFLTGYQTDFGGYLTHFCTHTQQRNWRFIRKTSWTGQIVIHFQQQNNFFSEQQSWFIKIVTIQPINKHIRIKVLWI